MNRMIALKIAALIALALQGAAAALAPRNDINPALLYWQAFAVYPVLTNDDARVLYEPAKATADETGKLAARFDNAFKLIHRAVHSTTPCDWGVDLADGPEAFVPSIPKIRTGAQAALLRAHVALANGQGERAARDLAAALAMARHIAVQGTLVQTMIQVSVEDLVVKFVAENFARFDTAGLTAVEREFAAARPRKSVADAMQFEKVCFFQWFVGQIESIRAANAGNEVAGMERIKAFWTRLFSEKSFSQLWDEAGRSTSGLLAYCGRTEKLYDELLSYASAAPAQLDPTNNVVQQRLDASGNTLAQSITPNISRARGKELEVLARWHMVRAALAFKLHGEAGFKAVADPFGSGPFVMTPTAGGFELRSQLADHGFKGTLAFGN